MLVQKWGVPLIWAFPDRERAARPGGVAVIGGNWAIATAASVFLGAARRILVPTTADFGLTWDEPAYRYSQEISQEWWERLGSARISGGPRGAPRRPTPSSHYFGRLRAEFAH